MHPTISYYLAQARIADLRRHAQRDTWPAPHAVLTCAPGCCGGPGPCLALHCPGRSARRGRRRTRWLSRYQVSGRRASATKWPVRHTTADDPRNEN